MLMKALLSLSGNPVLDSLMMVLSEVLVLLVPLSLVYLWLRDREGKENSVLIAGATFGAIAVSYLMGLLYSHQNPSATFETLVAFEPENAFPSQHTAAILAPALASYLVREKEVSAVLLISGLITGFARMYIGEHWPIDILGAFAAASTGMIIVYLFQGRFDFLEPIYGFSENIEDRIRKQLPSVGEE